ncbi:MAG: hypothetical protein MRERV_77c007 [Mycoplasmataceae bacterium RV_VA103A]|nr:MAG: hypothetical protein MRERV_77c007 [Mycoplasmataceae bacterium RV_VA103A]
MEAADIIRTILFLVIGIVIFIGWIWVVRQFILRTGSFICKRCNRKYPQKHETEKDLCKWCKERKEK